MNYFSKCALCTLILCTFMFTSCVTTKQHVKYTHNQSLPVNMARIYIVRPNIIGSAIPVNVKFDDKAIGKTGPKGYICYDVPPGEHVIRCDSEVSEYFTINAQPNEIYYIQQKFVSGWIKARIKMIALPDDKGKNMVIKLKEPVVNYTE